MPVAFDYEKYKPVLTDSTGKKLTAGLFEELADPTSAARPVFKLADWRKVYVDIADPTDYRAAEALIGNWDHWQALLKCQAFVAHLEQWREEVDTKLRSLAIASLVKQSKDIKGTAAAKWLAENGYAVKQRGRPKKEQPEVKSRVNDDAKRLALVPGGKA